MTYDLYGKDLDDAIAALSIKKATLKDEFGEEDRKQLKRLRNIRGSRNFRVKSKQFKKLTNNQDKRDLILQCTIEQLMA